MAIWSSASRPRMVAASPFAKAWVMVWASFSTSLAAGSSGGASPAHTPPPRNIRLTAKNVVRVLNTSHLLGVEKKPNAGLSSHALSDAERQRSPAAAAGAGASQDNG